MSTHNIQFNDEIRKFPYLFVFLSSQKNFLVTRKQVQISHGKRAISVKAIGVRLCFQICYLKQKTN